MLNHFVGGCYESKRLKEMAIEVDFGTQVVAAQREQDCAQQEESHEQAYRCRKCLRGSREGVKSLSD